MRAKVVGTADARQSKSATLETRARGTLLTTPLSVFRRLQPFDSVYAHLSARIGMGKKLLTSIFGWDQLALRIERTVTTSSRGS